MSGSLAPSVAGNQQNRWNDSTPKEERNAVLTVARASTSREDFWQLVDVLGLTDTALEMSRRRGCAPKA